MTGIKVQVSLSLSLSLSGFLAKWLGGVVIGKHC